MPTCQYFGQTDCTAPTFGGTSVPVIPGPHENGIEHYLLLGTSPLDWAINGFLWLLVIRFVLWPRIIVPLLDWLDFRRQQTVPTVCYELTPHHTTPVPAEAMVELFKILHAQYGPQTYEAYLLRRKECMSCEVLSTRAGIRYIMRVPAEKTEAFERAISSLQHAMQFKQVTASVGDDAGNYTAVSVFRQARSFAYPLRRHNDLAAHDPMTYLTSALAQPQPGETLAVQLVAAPYRDYRRAARMRNALLKGKEPWALGYPGVLSLCGMVLLGIYNVVVAILRLFGGRWLPVTRERGNGMAVATPASQAVRDSMIDKLGEPLFYVDIRAYVSIRDQRDGVKRLRGIRSALATFDEPGYQALETGTRMLSPRVSDAVLRRQFQRRLPSMVMRGANVLAASEMASLYHFPYEPAVTTEGVARAMSRLLPAPNALKRHADDGAFSLVLGENVYHGERTPVAWLLTSGNGMCMLSGARAMGRRPCWNTVLCRISGTGTAWR